MNIWFSADEHYFHSKIIEYEKRPFDNIDEMNECLINNHNSVVKEKDFVYHVGDFCWLKSRDKVWEFIQRLNGKHIFVKGSHDHWDRKLPYVIEKKIDGVYVVMCHYPMLVWPRSHYGSIQLHGHCHGHLKEHMDRQYDVGVDCNDYKPVLLDEIIERINEK